MRIDPAIFQAFALDLDGVITNTAAVRAASWKQLFDRLLERRAAVALLRLDEIELVSDAARVELQ